MNQHYLSCARDIHQTVRRLQERITGQFIRGGKEAAGKALADLTMPQCNALLALRDHVELTIKDFAERLHVSAPSASVMADKLVEMGMVERRPNPADRRAVLISVSPYGMEVINEVESELFSTLVSIMERLGEEKSRQWRELYESIGEILAEDEASNALAASQSAAEGDTE
ncbi:MAG: MarR family transcriptional regulator [Candidatus Hydrogenedens sp.]|nr:MarR family transcriptional regulator [Candidatus Hydrogenedens sp.]